MGRFRQARRQLRALARHGPPVEVPEVSGDRVDVARALAALSPRLRAVLVLHYVADLPVEEIAAQLRIPVGTVKSRLRRGRERLAPLVAVDDSDAGVTRDAR